MRVTSSKSKNSESLYIIKSFTENGARTTKTVERLGTVESLREKLGGADPHEWAKDRAAELTRLEKEEAREVTVKFSPGKLINKGEARSFNGGYMFLQRIYKELRLTQICQEISKRNKFEFDLDSILSRLIYGRIIFPSSKLATYELSKKFIEPPRFELHHIYRALDVIAREMDFLQAELYKNSKAVVKRKTGVLYYDLTNYFFEIEQEDGLKQYGRSKENRPNPIVQMGLFMDADGIPLSFCIEKGNSNEQTTLVPLEEKILKDFGLSKFVVCTDAGLSSTANRKFNNRGGRAFVTVQSVKKLKKHIKDWALSPDGWLLPGSTKPYNIEEIDEDAHKKSTFYKERWINEDGLEQKIVVTYSFKYRNYQRAIRDRQVERAAKLIASNPTKLGKVNQNDFKRFISKKSVTKDGELANKNIYAIDTDTIEKEEIYDGFYAACTNLDDDPSTIIKINHRRWEIEECFMIMKREFKSRPVYLGNDNRIEAHFMTCFIALLIFRILEKKLGEEFTCHEIISGLRDMNFYHIPGEGYVPIYTRNDFTDKLHESFGFRADCEIISHGRLKKFFTNSCS
jgi:hypothetical protein